MSEVRRVYLVGFMGAGKSSVGNELAGRLGWKFSDLDREIERSEGLSVQEIFRKFGEPHFRTLEREHLKRLSTLENRVIALGGGAYIDPVNRAVADSTGLTVWLKVSLANVFTRVTMDGTRPLLGDPPRAEKLYTERLPYYNMAQLHISTDDRSQQAIASEIASHLRKDPL